MIIFAADDPLVRNGTYDREGYKPGERARIAKARLKQQQLEEQMAKRARKTNGAEEKPKRGRPRNQDLPGMEDRAIKPLEDLAVEYAEVRDRRMALNTEEHDLKQNALKLMRKYGKTIYRSNGVTITVVEGAPDVKVKVAKKDDDEEAEGETAEFAEGADA